VKISLAIRSSKILIYWAGFVTIFPAFFLWREIIRLNGRGTIFLTTIFIIIAVTVTVAAIIAAIVVAITGGMHPRWTWLIPIICLSLFVGVMVYMAKTWMIIGWGILFAPPFLIWAILWRNITRIVTKLTTPASRQTVALPDRRVETGRVDGADDCCGA